jgi:Flp pilus assembly protein TadD
MVLLETGKTTEALEVSAQAEKSFPEDPRIVYCRAAVLARSGRSDEARTVAARALKLQPDFQAAKDLVQRLPPP